MCKDIMAERKRVGGNWAIAQAVPTRELRDVIRKELGPQLEFVILSLTQDAQKERIKKRHGDDESQQGFVDFLVGMLDKFEPAMSDEPRAIEISIRPEMAPEDVIAQILSSPRQ